MRFKGVVLLLLVAAAGVAAADKPAFAEKLGLVEAAGLDDVFSPVAVKAKRPMPWAIFAESRYRYFKGAGRAADGDLGRDAAAAVWLAILDEEYRRTGRLLFVEAGEVPGVDSDRWISLEEFERDVMPGAIHDPDAFGGGETERAIKELVERATALHGLTWRRLLVLPGEPEIGWRPLTPQSPLWGRVRELEGAYGAADEKGMRRAASSLAHALASHPGYPPRWKISLELYVNRYRVSEIGLGLYVLSSLLFFWWAASGRRVAGGAGSGLALAGFVVATAALAARSLITGYLPVTGLYEYALFLSWASALAFLIIYARTRAAYLGVILIPLALVLAAVASAFPSEIDAQVAPTLRSWWLPVHVILACLGEAAFAVAFAAAALRLFAAGGPGRPLPARDKLENVEYRAVALGYPLFTVGALVAGAVWAQEAWSTWWSWEPKQTCSLVVFILATAYLYARRGRGWRGARTSVLAVLIFAAAAFALFANVIFGGPHSFGI
ncbi:MAG TPA: cytochrome c biogenesis protein CcsA [bacterium]|nr:cytochrome c biogenesis protein CcsA [bacterium]